YDFVFVPLTGINHNQKCVTFGATLLSDETEDSHRWMLKAFLKVHQKQPTLALTDQDAALRNAIVTMFPESKHRLSVKAMKKQLEVEMQSSNYDNNKEALYADLLGVTVPEQVVIKNPKKSSNKDTASGEDNSSDEDTSDDVKNVSDNELYRYDPDFAPTPNGTPYWRPDLPEDEKPKLGDIFDTFDDGYNMYKVYSKKGRFNIRKSGIKRYKGKVTHRYVLCNRAGKLRSKFDINTLKEADTNDEEKDGPTLAHRLKVALMGGYDKVRGTPGDYRNFKRAVNLLIGDRDAQMIVDKMINRQLHVPEFSFEHHVLHDELVSRFWADDTMKCNYAVFSDVVSFDATFRTNKIPETYIHRRWTKEALPAHLLEKRHRYGPCIEETDRLAAENPKKSSNKGSKRRKSATEIVKAKKKPRTTRKVPFKHRTCSKCGGKGHNKRKCTGKKVMKVDEIHDVDKVYEIDEDTASGEDNSSDEDTSADVESDED
nr:protein FAR1-related sequence 5-like [Tanacetum cinerariifolium]